MRGISMIKTKIKEEREKLHTLIVIGGTEDEILKQSEELDKLIIKSYLSDDK